MTDTSKPSRREFIKNTLVAGGGLTVAGIGYHVTKKEREYVRQLQAMRQSLDQMERTELTFKETVETGPLILPMDPAMPIIIPGGKSEKDKRYMIPKAFLDLHKKQMLDDPDAVAKIFGVRLSDDDRRNADKLIACYGEGGIIQGITIGNIAEQAEIVSGLIKNAPARRNLAANELSGRER